MAHVRLLLAVLLLLLLSGSARATPMPGCIEVYNGNPGQPCPGWSSGEFMLSDRRFMEKAVSLCTPPLPPRRVNPRGLDWRRGPPARDARHEPAS